MHFSFDQAIPLTEISLKEKLATKQKSLMHKIIHYRTICNSEGLGNPYVHLGDRVNRQQSICTKETLKAMKRNEVYCYILLRSNLQDTLLREADKSVLPISSE